MQDTKIEWATATWNPVRGCSRVSEGCRHCYAERMAARFIGPGQYAEGFAKRVGGEGRWTGKVELIPAKLGEPLRMRKPRRVFVNSMSDLFHEGLSDEAIAAVFGVMAACPQHTFQVLTKRPERAAEWFAWAFAIDGDHTYTRMVAVAARLLGADLRTMWSTEVSARIWPPPNVWLGTSAEDQPTLDARALHLLRCPAAIHFLSLEPLLGPLYLGGERGPIGCYVPDTAKRKAVERWLGPFRGSARHGVDWIIAGGESGPGARSPHPDWFRSVRDQCSAAGVAFFFKQWGAWAPGSHPSLPQRVILSNGEGCERDEDSCSVLAKTSGGRWSELHATVMHRAGKAAAGALLDGREHREFPETT